jgi:hypothetical protein
MNMSGSTMTRAAALTRVTGQSGRQYFVERLLQDRPSRHGRVYLATLVITINNEQMTERLTFPCRSRDRRYVLKTVPTTIYDRYKAMFDDLRGTPYIHVAEDTDSEICAFIYPYRRDDYYPLLSKMFRLLQQNASFGMYCVESQRYMPKE